MLKSVLTIGSALLLLGSAAIAQERPAARACAGDIKTLCAGVQPGEGRIRACVKQHFNELSEPCQAIVLKAAAIGKACRADVKQFCADVKPGGGRIEACIKPHIAEVSDPCREALSAATAGKS